MKIVSKCTSQPCRNGGTCVDGPFTYSCKCRSPFKGQQCESVSTIQSKLFMDHTKFSCQKKTILAPCDSNPCLNSGACLISGNTFTCSCPPGYIGSTCETNIRPGRILTQMVIL